MRKLLSLSVLAVALTLGGCAQGGGYNGYSNSYQEPTRIEYGRVMNTQQVSTGGASTWGYGAAAGGAAGLLSGRGHSTESKVIRGALGALAGAAVNKAVTSGSTTNQVLIQTRHGGQFNVRHGSNDLAYGDCVQIETRNGGNVRLYRASPTQCNF